MSAWELTMPSRRPQGRRSRRYRWRRRVVIAVAAVMIAGVLAIGAFIKLQPTAAPLMLPRGPAAAPAGPVAGTWRVGNGSAAGFRVEVTAVGISNYAVGRTSDVTGTIVVTGDRVTSAAFGIDLTTIKVDGKAQPQVAASLDTAAHPRALVTLTRPVSLGPGFVGGATISERSAGMLTVDGESHPVTVSWSARRAGTLLEAAGSIPVTFSTWRIGQPSGFGFLGSVAGHGVAEFLLILRRG